MQNKYESEEILRANRDTAEKSKVIFHKDESVTTSFVTVTGFMRLFNLPGYGSPEMLRKMSETTSESISLNTSFLKQEEDNSDSVSINGSPRVN